jgi:hypothetical protein
MRLLTIICSSRYLVKELLILNFPQYSRV